MKDLPTDIELAFQLARTGHFQNVEQIRNAMSREGYSPATVVGPTLTKQLREAIKEARSPKVRS